MHRESARTAALWSIAAALAVDAGLNLGWTVAQAMGWA